MCFCAHGGSPVEKAVSAAVVEVALHIDALTGRRLCGSRVLAMTTGDGIFQGTVEVWVVCGDLSNRYQRDNEESEGGWVKKNARGREKQGRHAWQGFLGDQRLLGRGQLGAGVLGWRLFAKRSEAFQLASEGQGRRENQ